MIVILAYFDPGAGSLLVQALAGGTAGLLVFGKYVWDAVSAKRRKAKGLAVGLDRNSLPAASSGEIPIIQ
jgi:hypothetical protein